MFSVVLLHNTYLKCSTPHPGTGKRRLNQSQCAWVSGLSRPSFSIHMLLFDGECVYSLGWAPLLCVASDCGIYVELQASSTVYVLSINISSCFISIGTFKVLRWTSALKPESVMVESHLSHKKSSKEQVNIYQWHKRGKQARVFLTLHLFIGSSWMKRKINPSEERHHFMYPLVRRLNITFDLRLHNTSVFMWELTNGDGGCAGRLYRLKL